MRWRRIFGFLLIAFAIFFVFTAPAEAAVLLRSTVEFTGGLLLAAGRSLATFARTLAV